MDRISLAGINDKGLILIGCGKMGSALLRSWLANGIEPSSVTVMAPRPSSWLLALEEEGLRLNCEMQDAAACVLAVKPQILSASGLLDDVIGKTSLFISIAAGTTLGSLAVTLGPKVGIVRAMPNIPAMIGQGITALIGNAACTPDQINLSTDLLESVGQVVRIEDERQMDIITGVSGSGPAYIFHFIECLAAAGTAHGLAPELAMRLAKATVSGAGILAQNSDETVDLLRRKVTSPAGTTAAGLDVLMDKASGLQPLVEQTVGAAIARSIELGKG